MTGAIQFISLGLVQEDPDDIIKIIVGEVDAPLAENDEIVCEITMSNRVKLNPDFDFFRGDHHNQQFRVTLGAESYDLTGAEVIFSLKLNLSDETPLIQKKNAEAGGSASQIEMSSPEEGRFVVYILPDDTSEVLGDNTYWYDIEIYQEGERRTVKRGQVRILQDVTV